MIGLTLGQQSWLRLLNIEHHEVMAVSNELNEKGYERGVAGLAEHISSEGEASTDHRPRADRSRYSVIALIKLALHVLTGFWAQLVQWMGAALGVLGILTSLVVGIWGLVYWIRYGNFPGPLLLGGLVLFVLGLQGFVMAVLGENLQRIQRDVEQRPLYYIDRELG